MAKMFYTLEEAAARLGKPAEEVTRMAASGQIQEFRDRDKLMFKKEQIDLLAGDDEVEPIGLADSAENKAIADKDKEESVLGLMDSKESTGISIFDADDLEKADPSAATQVSDSISPAGFSLDPHASGSGLLDLTREADDTSLGAVLDDIKYPGEEAAAQSGGASGLFAAPAAEAPVGAGALVMPSTVEYYDGAGSGLAVGLAIGALVSLLLSTLVLFTALVGDQTVAGIARTIAESLWMYVGIFAGITIVSGIIGWFVGKTFQ
ncbi:MAG: hypothetical protein KJZ69_10480 [Phycisphaerales bacterium]|nr:hypothetical protein [Phycisphaerales bacterium]